MIERLVNSFRTLKRLQGVGSYRRSMIEDGLDEVTQYVDRSNGYVPVFADKIPRFSSEVNAYIRRRARKDLPHSQFDGIPQKREELVEIGGVLVYGNNGLIEVKNSPPDIENVRELVELPTSTYPGEFAISRRIWDEFYGGRPYNTFIETATRNHLTSDDLNEGNIVIDWHTHPNGRVPSLGDVNSMLKLADFVHGKKLYSVIYVPRDDQTYWFEIGKA